MELKGAIFDLDGTLVDSLTFWEWQYNELAKVYCGGKKIELSPKDDKLFRTSLINDSVVLLHNKYGLANSSEELLDYVNKSIQRFYLNEARPKKGVIQFLNYLKSKNVKMCIASATAKPELELAVSSCGLNTYFEGVISCSEFGVGKNKPDVFLAALDLIGTDINDTWVFEDSLVALETSVKAGFKTVGIFDKMNPYTPEQLKEFSTIFVGEDKTLADLIENHI